MQNDTGVKVDAIVEIADGEYGAIEIKLGANKEEEAVESLKKFYELAEVKPKFMCVICGLYDAVIKRPDGIYVLPITALRPQWIAEHNRVENKNFGGTIHGEKNEQQKAEVLSN